MANAVKQNTKTGAVAVQAGADRWGVMHPEHGGHWANDDEVADWTDLKPVPEPKKKANT